MRLYEEQRELVVDQSHLGTILLAGLLSLVTTCSVAMVFLGWARRLARSFSWFGCLILPVFLALILFGFLFLRWGERFLPRIWPSGRRLVLDGRGLTLVGRRGVLNQISWQEPFDVLRWRLFKRKARSDQERGASTVCLACQLRQRGNRISVYTICSTLDWRRVPGWKTFASFRARSVTTLDLIDAAGRTPASRARWWALSRQRTGSMPEADPEAVGPAEDFRRSRGWALDLDDFCALMAIIEACDEMKEQHDRTESD
jgi:hypothetical protein